MNKNYISIYPLANVEALTPPNNYVIYSPQIKRYIKSGTGIELTDNINLALIFTNYTKAQNIIKCSLSRAIKNLGTFEVYGYDRNTHSCFSLAPNYVPPTNKVNGEMIDSGVLNAEKIELKAPPSNGSEHEALDALKGLNYSINKFLETGKSLNVSLSLVDKEIVDLEHYIELSFLNAAEGYKAFKKLQDKLIQRRHIKDQMDIINQMTAKGMSPDAFADIVKYIDRMESRCYFPRTDILSEVITA